jgi:hypothetical protein
MFTIVKEKVKELIKSYLLDVVKLYILRKFESIFVDESSKEFAISLLKFASNIGSGDTKISVSTVVTILALATFVALLGKFGIKYDFDALNS